MTQIGIKKKGEEKINHFDSKEFGLSNKEDKLHKIVEKNPDLFFSEISPSIIFLGSKVNLPASGKELDLIFCNDSGEIFIVEIKRERSPRDALTQLTDYASSIYRLSFEKFFKIPGIKGFDEVKKELSEESDLDLFKQNIESSLKRPHLLLICPKVSEDIIRMAKYERNQSNKLINCIDFEYYTDKEENEIFVPKIIDLDETEDMEERELEKNKDELSPRQKLYFNFFTKVIEKFKKIKPESTSRKGTKDSWMQLPIGYSKYHMEWQFRGIKDKRTLAVAIHLESKDAKENYKILEGLKKDTSGLPDLKFEKWGKNWARVEILYSKKIDILKLDENQDLINWAVETMVKFYEFFKESGLFDKVLENQKDVK